MSFLSIKAVHLDSKECEQDKTTQSQETADTADNSSSKNVKIKENNGKENIQKQKKHKLIIGPENLRLPRKGKSRLKSLMMSPVATNSPNELSSFPKLISIEKDARNVRKLENEILAIKRSSSAPGCSYVQAKVTKQKFRLPCIPDLRALSITEDQPIKSLVVEGKKLRSVDKMGSMPDSSDSSHDLPKSDSNNSENHTKKLTADDAIDSGKERCHGDWYEDSFPSIKKADLRVKTAYTGSSRMFNTYLQSRFGKSVYERSFRKTGTSGNKTFQVYWAPVLIKKKILYNRTSPATCSQENRGETILVEEGGRKEKKILLGGSIYAIGGSLWNGQEKEWSSGEAMSVIQK